MTTGDIHVGFVVCAPVFFEGGVLLEAVLPFGHWRESSMAAYAEAKRLPKEEPSRPDRLTMGRGGVECLFFGVLGTGIRERDGIDDGG